MTRAARPPTIAANEDGGCPLETDRAKLRSRLRALLLAAICVLYVVSIPWYREGGAAGGELWFGLPDWVAVALGCYVGVALLNSVAWLLTDLRDPEVRDPEAEPRR